MVPSKMEKFKHSCEKCNYFTSRESQYSRHLLTSKHKKLIESNNCKVEESFDCECGKKYKHKSTLYSHRIHCKFQKYENTISPSVNETGINESIINDNKELKTMIIELMKQNQNIMELASKVGNNNNNVNSNNSFNLNFFLNETCKDAINMNEFIKNIEIQLKEVENVGNNGYVLGITDIILNRLKQLDVTKRPVHCTDLKRETLYIKDENAWNKDTNENEKMRNVITTVANKNYRTIPKWRAANPECQEPENDKYDFCITMMRNALGDLGEEQTKLDDKVIKNIAKQVIVDKNTTTVV